MSEVPAFNEAELAANAKAHLFQKMSDSLRAQAMESFLHRRGMNGDGGSAFIRPGKDD